MNKFYFWYLLTLIIVALLPQAADAQQNRTQQETSSHVTAQQAMDIGYAFMHTGKGSKGNGTKSGAVRKQAMQLVYTGRATDSLTRAVTDCYYVFALQPKGFVIVAADDRVEPILGYSYDNDFVVENMPAHVRSWLGAYEKQIEAVAKSDIQTESTTRTKWTRLKSGQSISNRNGESVGPLIQTHWSQNQYYNQFCPADANGPGGHVPAGCVAIAMAQVIRYWEYPTIGEGSWSYYDYTYGTQSANFGSTIYDYSMMPAQINYYSSQAQKDAVATLIYHCGVSVQTIYGTTESAAHFNVADGALRSVFVYPTTVSEVQRSNYSDTVWEDMMKNELQNQRPVLYSGNGSGAHAFILDGYNSDNRFHINWGWGGSYDGYFSLSSLTPGGFNYSNNQTAVIGIDTSIYLPTVTTDTVSNIRATAAKCGGNITSNGGATVTACGICWSTSPNPTVSDSHTTNSGGTGTFISYLTELTPNTTYYVRAYATNSVGTAYGENVTFTTNISDNDNVIIDEKSCPGTPTVTDHEGNVYGTVRIGNQCWMRENLRTTTSPSTGTYLIPTTESSTYSGKQARWYNNDMETYAPLKYGLLYNWNAAVDTFYHYDEETSVGNSSTAESVDFTENRRGICPVGWHLPSDAEWATLTDYLNSRLECVCDGNSSDIAMALASDTAWGISSTNCSCCDVTGFSAVPAGSCIGSSFSSAGSNSFFWTATQYGSSLYGRERAYLYTIYGNSSYSNLNFRGSTDYKNCGYSVRCLRDNAPSEISFSLSTVTTDSVSNITVSSATCGGEVIADGGAVVLERGVCWSTSESPTIAGDYTAAGTGMGTFNVIVSGLTPGTTYFVRAYATNCEGTAYGEDVTFTTLDTIPTVITNMVSDITANTATCGGNVIADGGATVIARGVCWSTSANPTVVDAHTSDGTGTGAFTSEIIGLSPGTIYHIRAYAINSEGTTYGEDVTFTTSAILPTVITDTIGNITATSATCGGFVTADGGAVVMARGVCWSTLQNPTVADAHTNDSTGTGAFTSVITGLTPNTTYYVRAYATNSVGTAYGEEVVFITSTTMPTVRTNRVSNITATSATCGGEVTADGGATVIACGFCWSIIANPTIADAHTSDSTGMGSFTSTITGLAFGTTYHVRAYATNSEGTAYGEDMMFTTAAILPTIITGMVSDITAFSATCGGQVTSDGGAAITAYGICWSTSQTPTIADTHTNDSTGTEAFTSAITDLAPGTTYYVRAYATNNVGTAYGEEVMFTTFAILPTVTTRVIEIMTTMAMCGGDVTFDGGAEVTERGFCWSISQNPTVSDSHMSVTTETGSFFYIITDLAPGTTYYVRAYATNSEGTAYGEEVSFTTLATLPTVTTSMVNNIMATTATCGGNVTYDGGVTSTTRGVCWSTTQNPTIADNHTNDGTGIGAFISQLTDLEPGTVYFVRAYATNSVGTVYGEEVTFTTFIPVAESMSCPGTPTFTDSNGNLYNTLLIGEQCWIKENLRNVSGTEGFNWPEAMQSCPSGWHLPSEEEWVTLNNYVENDGIQDITVQSFFENIVGNYGDFFWTSSTMPYTYETTTTTFVMLVQLYPIYVSFGTAYDVNDAGGFYHSIRCLRNGMPTVITDTMSNIMATTATCGGNVTYDGGTTVTARGVCWSTTQNPTVADNHTNDGTGTDAFISQLIDLTPNTTYYVRAYAMNSVGTAYGEEVTFTTACAQIPIITDSVLCEGGSMLFATIVSAVAPGSEMLYTWYKDNVIIANESSNQLLASETGYYKVVVSLDGCSTESAEIFVNERSAPQLQLTVTETDIFIGDVTTITADANDFNGDDFLYSWSNGHTGATYTFVPDHIGSFAFDVTVSNILTGCESSASITVNVHNQSSRYNCGDDLIVNGNIYTTQQYGSQCWMTRNLRDESGSEYYSWSAAKLACPNGWHLPDKDEWDIFASYVDNNSGQDGNIPLFFENASGEFWMDYTMPWDNDTLALSCYISGQNINTNYGAYEVNQTGLLVFTRCLRNENASAVLPTVTTDVVSNITDYSATCGGNVTADGGTEVTERGVCWSNSSNPTAVSTGMGLGTGTGTFSVNLTDLNPGITYHVRAYATNSAGTAYGEEVTFTTTGCAPISIIIGDSVLCEGGSMLFATIASAVASNSEILYTWYKDNVIISNESSNQLLASETGYYKVVVTLDGCSTESAEVFVNERSAPQLQLTVTETDIIIGDATTITADANDFNGDDFLYSWSNGHTGATYTFASDHIGSFPFDVTVTNILTGCESSASITVNVHDQSLRYNCGDDLIVNGNIYTTQQYGSQCWMTRNLRNESGSEYYSWVAAKQACPNGWHLPDKDEWDIFASYVDNNSGQDSNIPLFFENASGEFWMDYTMPLGNDTFALPCYISGQNINTNYGAYEVNQTGLLVLTRCLRDENASAVLPTVTTDAVSNITDYSATCGGNVTADGGTEVTERGVCWSTSSNPTIVVAGAGTGTFSVNLTDLNPGFTYHVRAYATNSAGTAYGEEVTFTTTGCAPIPIIIGDSVLCEGGSMLFATIVSAVAPGSEMLYTWYKDNVIIANESSNQLLASETGYYKVVVSLDGCSTESAEIFVNESSAPQLQITVTETDILIGDATTIMADANDFNGDDFLYSWSNGHTGATYTFVPDHIGSFTFDVTVTNTLTGCESSASITVNVHDQSSRYNCGDDLIVNGNIYTTQQYGSQCWMTRNLRNASGSERVYWPDVLQVCPTGWHLPSQDEWCILGNYMNNNSSQDSNFGDGDFWTSTTSLWEDYEGNQYTLITFPTVRSSSVNCSPGISYEIYDAGRFLFVRCLRDENAFAVLPTITTDTVSNITGSSASCGGNVTADGGTEVTERGICWSISQNTNVVVSGAGTGTFSVNITDLNPGATYRVRAYATNSAGTAYGEEVMFTTTQSTDTCLTLPTAIVDGPDFICYGDANSTISVNITDPDVYFRDWSYIGSAQEGLIDKYSESISMNGFPAGTHIFGANIFDTITHCTNTIYDTVRVVSVNAEIMVEPSGAVCENGTVKAYCSYSQQDETDAIVSCTWFNGNHVENVSPGVYDTVWVVPTLYASNISLLVMDNHGCTGSFGRSINVVACATLPSVTTDAVSNILATTATGGGNVTDNGGADVTERGVCWSTSVNPTIIDNHTSDGIGTGAFTSNLTNLTPNTTYYVRAYATNSEGTAYGEEVMFTTTDGGVDTGSVEVPVGPLFKFSEINGTESICSMEANQGEPSMFEMYLYDNGVSPAEPNDKVFIDFQIYKDGVPMSDAELAEVMDNYEGANKMLYDFDLSVGAANISNMTMQSATNSANGFIPNIPNQSWLGGMSFSYDWFYMHFFLGTENADHSHNGRKITVNTGVWKPGSSGVYTFSYAVIKAGLGATNNNGLNYEGTKRLGGYGSHSVLTVKDTIAYDYFTIYVNGTGGGSDTTDACLTLPTATVDGPDFSCYGDANSTISVNITDADVYFREWSYIGSAQEGLIDKYSESISLNGFPAGTHIFGANIFDTITHCTNTIYDTIRVVSVNAEVRVEPAGAVCENDTVKAYCSYSQQDETDTIINYYWFNGNHVENVSQSVYDTVWVVPTLYASNISLLVMDNHGCTGAFGRSINVVACATLPTVTTDAVSNILATTATCGGNVSDDGGATVTERGVCWSTSPNPTVDDSHTIDGSGVGAFTSQLSGLEPNTTYYVRAYAMNSEGTVYGEEVMFTTADGSIPSMFTCGDSLIFGGNTYTTQQYGSQCWMTRNLRNTSGGEGFTWSVAMHACPAGWHLPTPGEWGTLATYVDNNTQDSNIPLFFAHPGIGRFWEAYTMNWEDGDGNVWALAYASEFSGQHIQPGSWNLYLYSVDENYISIRCLRDENASVMLPTVTTDTVSNIMASSATCGGNVIDDGGTELTERGICWSSSQNSAVVVAGAGMGAYTVNLTDLTPGVTYHVRAYATNSAGTAYGEEVTFTTIFCHGSITLDTSVCVYDLPLIWNEYIFYGSETYTTTYQTADGCDSVVILRLTLKNSSTGDTTVTVCESFDWYGMHLTQSGEYTQTLTNAAGCDSVVTLHLTVNYPNTSDTTAIVCGNFDWYGMHLTQSGEYTYTLTNTAGCDSMVTLHLTINTATYGDTTATVCGSFDWYGMHLTQSGDYTHTLTNVASCDSVVTLHLTVNDTPQTPIVTVDNNVICDGGDVTLSITNPDPNPLTLYTWYRNGIVIPGATHTNFVDMPTTIGGETANYTYNVVATYFNSGCYSSSSALTVTVNDVPATPVLAVDNANVFEGAEVTVSVTNPIDGAVYTWYRNGVIIEDATQAVFVDYLTAIDGETTDYAYNVVAVLPISGCVSDISASTVVTVNALPTATVTVEGNTVLCDGGSVTLHVDVTPNDNSTYVYQWYEDGMLISGATSADYVVVKPIRDYPYNFMVVVSVMNAGFDITAHAPAITVAPAPMVTAFISDTVICEGGTVSMTAWVDGNNSGEGYNLQWFRETPGVLTAEPVGTDITYTTTGNELAGSYIYWLEVTNEYGCSSQSDPVMLTINQPTTGIDVQTVCGSYTWIDGITYTESNNTATYTLTNAVGCDSVVTLHLTVNDTPPTPVVTVDNANIFEGAQLTVSVTNPIDGAVYTWYRNGVIIEGATQAVFMDTLTTIDGGTAHYTYSVFAVLPTSGCVSNISSSTMVTVNPLPVAMVTVEGNTVLCEGSSVTLHADVAPYNDPTYVYQWYDDGVPIPSATSADYVVLEPARTNPYNFMVMVSGMNGSFNITANAPAITVMPSPTVVASISESTICVGGTATLTATVEGGVAGINGYNFQWYGIAETSMPWPEVVGTGSSYTTSGDEPAGNYPYWVTVSDEYGCSSQSGMVILAVVSQPTVTITRTVGYGEMVCEGGSTAIQANVTGGYGELSYQWYENGYILTDETNQFLAINNLAYGVNDTYTVMVAQTGAGCSNSASADINTLVSVYPSYTVAVSGPNDICEGGDLTMFAEVNNVIPGDMLSYQWHEIISGQDLLIEGANSILYTAVDLQSGSLYEYYVVVNSNLSGCTATSSVHVVNVNALSYTNLYETSCEYYTWNDMTYSASGEYTQTFTNAAGCDSVVTLHLTVNTPTEGDTTAIVCGSFSWYEYSELTQSGDYTHTLTNAAGCDSIVTLHLTVNIPTEGDTTATVCGSFSWYEYSDLTQSGDYTHTITNSAGCDSIVTLHLTVNIPTEGDTTATVCGSFSWYEYSDLTQSGDYTHTITNSAGCDSVVTLHLTVNTPTEGDTTAIVCGNFNWYEYSDLTQSGDYTHTLTNSAGCDSIVTLHLTVNAQWQVDSYDLNVNQVTGGTITMTVSYVDETVPGTVNSYSTTTDTTAIFESWIQLSADADYGYDFVDFLVITASGDTLETPNNGFTMPAENVTVTAVFTLHNFNITVNVSDETPWGTVTGSGSFAYGSTDTLTATPMDEHHIFVGWSDYNTENPRVITVTHDSTITAYFVPEEIEIIGNDTVMGSVSVNIPGGGHLTPSTPIVITATPEPHYHFVSWSDGNTDNPRTIFPIQAIGLTAVFAIDQHTITVLSNDYTWGEVIGGGIYDYGTEISICANALAGYEFLSWGDGNTDNPRHITVEQDSAFTAIFQLADGINVANMSKVTVYSYTNQIVVVNAEGFSVEIFDMSGRLLVIEQNVSQSVRKYTIATDGIYLVKVGKNVFKKVKISR